LSEVGIEWDAKYRNPLSSTVVRDAEDSDLSYVIKLKVNINGQEINKRFMITEKMFLMYNFDTEELEESFTPEWVAYQNKFLEEDRKEEARVKAEEDVRGKEDEILGIKLDEVFTHKKLEGNEEDEKVKNATANSADDENENI